VCVWLVLTPGPVVALHLGCSDVSPPPRVSPWVVLPTFSSRRKKSSPLLMLKSLFSGEPNVRVV
jgi:hypothetical protein